MKHFLRCLWLGIVEMAACFLALMFLSVTVDAFLAFLSATGWVALGLFVSGLLCGFMFLFIVVVMGAAIVVPKDEAKEFKERLDEYEGEEVI